MGLLDEFEHDKELKDLIKDKIQENPSFKNVFYRDLTHQINENLKKRMFGEMTNHFVIFISGVPGVTSTGTMKSSVAMELAQKYDPQFNVEKITFTNDQLMDTMSEQAIVDNEGSEQPQVFIRDETIKTLKTRAAVEFSIVVETLRDSRISLIVVKPEGEPPDVAHYHFQSFLFNKKKKTVRLAVYNHANDKYRGYIEMPLQWNAPIWHKYMERKKDFQRMVVSRKTSSFDEAKYGNKIIEKYGTEPFFDYTKKGDIKLLQTTINRYLQKEYPQLTNDERGFVKDWLKQKIKGEEN